MNSYKTVQGEAVKRDVSALVQSGGDSSGEGFRGNSGHIPDQDQPQWPSRQHALPGPVSARLCAHPQLGLSRHPTVGMVFPAASHSALPLAPPSPSPSTQWQ